MQRACIQATCSAILSASLLTPRSAEARRGNGTRPAPICPCGATQVELGASGDIRTFGSTQDEPERNGTLQPARCSWPPKSETGLSWSPRPRNSHRPESAPAKGTGGGGASAAASSLCLTGHRAFPTSARRLSPRLRAAQRRRRDGAHPPRRVFPRLSPPALRPAPPPRPAPPHNTHPAWAWQPPPTSLQPFHGVGEDTARALCPEPSFQGRRRDARAGWRGCWVEPYLPGRGRREFQVGVWARGEGVSGRAAGRE